MHSWHAPYDPELGQILLIMKSPTACLCEVGRCRPSWEPVIQAAIVIRRVFLTEVVPEWQLLCQARLAAVVPPQAAPDLKVEMEAKLCYDIIRPGPRGNNQAVRQECAAFTGHDAYLLIGMKALSCDTALHSNICYRAGTRSGAACLAVWADAHTLSSLTLTDAHAPGLRCAPQAGADGASLKQ